MPLVQRARSEESMGMATDTKTATIQLKGIGGTELPIDTVQVPTPTSAVAIRAAVSAALSIPSSSFELVVAGQTVEAASGADFAAAGHTVTVVPSGRSGFDLRRDKAPHCRLVPSDPSSSSAAAAEMMGCTAAASGSIETEADLDHVAVMLRQLPCGNDVDGHPKVMVAMHGTSGKPAMVALDPEEALRMIGQMKAEMTAIKTIEASPTGGGGGDGDEPSEAASEPGSLFSDSKYPRAHAPTPTPGPTPAPAPAPTTAASPDEQFRVMQMRYNQMVDAAKTQSKKRSENLRTARAMELLRDKRAAKAARRERRKRAKTAGGAAATSTEPVSATAAGTTMATPAATLAATASTAATTVTTTATAEKASATRRLPTSKTLKPARSLFGGFSKGFLN